MIKQFVLICLGVIVCLSPAIKCEDGEPVVPPRVSFVNVTEELPCPLFGQGMGKISWFKNGAEIVDEKKNSYIANEGNGTLTIKQVGASTSGEFICSNGTNNASVTLNVSPYVKQYEKGKNVIEGDPFQTDCIAWGFPAVTIVWYVRHESDPEPIVLVADGDRVVLSNGTWGQNATLRINNVDFSDGGSYICVAESDFGSANATLEVKVKDKLAALWPFLGICAEVIILCTIIFIYEKRRNKRLQEEEDRNEQETERMNTQNDVKTNDDLRQRKA